MALVGTGPGTGGGVVGITEDVAAAEGDVDVTPAADDAGAGAGDVTAVPLVPLVPAEAGDVAP